MLAEGVSILRGLCIPASTLSRMQTLAPVLIWWTIFPPSWAWLCAFWPWCQQSETEAAEWDISLSHKRQSFVCFYDDCVGYVKYGTSCVICIFTILPLIWSVQGVHHNTAIKTPLIFLIFPSMLCQIWNKLAGGNVDSLCVGWSRLKRHYYRIDCHWHSLSRDLVA